MKILRHRAFARAGLIGNPSDGYAGKTISFTFRNFAAEVVLYPWSQLEIVWSDQDKTRFDSLADLVEDVKLNGYYGGVRLVKATIKRFAEYCELTGVKLHDQPFSIRYATTIPRGVGLSGSSAIVVATLRCLKQFYDIQIPPIIEPSLARSVEDEELGIACGYQDRVVQVYEGLVYMDFSSMQDAGKLKYGRYERLSTDNLPPVYVAIDLAAGKISSWVHAPLRERVARDSALRKVIDQIADLVPRARQAIEQGARSELHILVDQNLDLRRQLYRNPSSDALADAARQVGASANYAGSGGAIVGTCPDEHTFQILAESLTRQNLNWRVLRPDLGEKLSGERSGGGVS